MTLQLPTPPHFEKDGTPTVSFRNYINDVFNSKNDKTESQADLTKLELLISSIDSGLKQKQAVKLEEYKSNDTATVFVFQHSFGTDKIVVNVFKDTSNTDRLHFVDVNSKQITLTFSAAVDAYAAHMLVKAWSVVE